MKSPLLGILGAGIISWYSMFETSSDQAIYFSMLSILIVLGGTACAAIITFGIKELTQIAKITLKVFTKKKEDPSLIIRQILEVTKSSEKGKNELKRFLNDPNIHPFIKDGIRLWLNDFSDTQLLTSMKLSLMERKNHQMGQVNILKTLAKYPPSFGMIGTVIGLVGILQNLGTSAQIGLIGPSMAVALITTLYGLFLANFIFIPMGDNLHHRLTHDFLVRKIIIKGFEYVLQGHDVILTQEMLSAYLNPGIRSNLNIEERQ